MNLKITKYQLFYMILMLPFMEPPILGNTAINNLFLGLKILSVSIIIVNIILGKIRLNKLLVTLIIYELIIIFSTILNHGEIVKSISNAAAVLGICIITDHFIKRDMYFCLKFITIIYFFYSIINLGKIIFIDKIPPFVGVLEGVGFLGMDNRFVFTFLPMIVFAALIAYEKKNKLNLLAIMCLGISIFTLFYTWSVAAMVAITLLGIYYLLIIKNDKISNFLNLSCVIIAANIGIVLFKIQNLFANFIANTLHKDINMSGRVFLWDVGLNEISNRPLLGYGVNEAVVRSKLWNLAHFHNYFINMIYIGGFIDLITFIIFNIILGKKAMKHRHDYKIKIIVFAIFIGMVLSIFDTLDYPMFFALYIVAYNICLQLENKVITNE